MNSLLCKIGERLFPSIYWRTHNHALHLTFDDGPNPEVTPQVLDVLATRNARATFFLVGKNVQKYSDLTRRIASEGHAVGNHTFTHPLLFFRSRRFQLDEVVRADEVIEEAIGTKPVWFRPPYGYFDSRTLSVAKQTEHRLVFWDVDSQDYRDATGAAIARRVLKKAETGSILLLHDNYATKNKIVDILNLLFDGLEERGIRLNPRLP